MIPRTQASAHPGAKPGRVDKRGPFTRPCTALCSFTAETQRTQRMSMFFPLRPPRLCASALDFSAFLPESCLKPLCYIGPAELPRIPLRFIRATVHLEKVARCGF